MLNVKIALVSVCFLVGACAPGYQSVRYTGGYEDYQAGAGAIFVAYRGNGLLDRSTVVRYWHMRAAEVCGGQDKYEILQLEARGEEEPLSGREVTYSEKTSKDDHGVSRETKVTEEPPRTVTKYEAEGYVRCANGGSYDPRRQLWREN